MRLFMVIALLLAACNRKDKPEVPADSSVTPPPVAANSTSTPARDTTMRPTMDSTRLPPQKIDSVIHPTMTENLRIDSPGPNAVITSPLTVSGQARGSWYFEGSFPIILLGPGGDTLAMTPAHARSDWMTENFVPFAVTFLFNPPPRGAGNGVLVFRKDNPSGLPAHDEQFRLPVRF